MCVSLYSKTPYNFLKEIIWRMHTTIQEILLCRYFYNLGPANQRNSRNLFFRFEHFKNFAEFLFVTDSYVIKICEMWSCISVLWFWFLKRSFHLTCTFQTFIRMSRRIIINLVLWTKAYDCLPHNFLVAELKPMASTRLNLNSIDNYLSNRKEQTKINSSYSDCYDIVRGVP